MQQQGKRYNFNIYRTKLLQVSENIKLFPDKLLNLNMYNDRKRIIRILLCINRKNSREINLFICINVELFTSSFSLVYEYDEIVTIEPIKI